MFIFVQFNNKCYRHVATMMVAT